MTKSEEIVRTIFTIMDFRVGNHSLALDTCIKKVEEIIERKCGHPIIAIARSENSRTGYKCFDCDKEVIAVKFEELP